MQNNLFELTKAQKKKFYSQELFDDYIHIKKNLRYIIIFIGIFELCRIFIVETHKNTQTLMGYQKWIASLTATLGSVIYLFSTYGSVEKKSVFRTNVRLILLVLSCVFLSVGTFLRTLWELRFAIATDDPETWLDTFTISTNLAFGIVFTDVIFPNWILKLLLPVSMFIGLVMAIIQAGSDNKFVLLFRVLSVALYVICLSILKDRFRWKIFSKRMEDEGWKALQSKILEEIPTSIAILDRKIGKIIYTNEEFKRKSVKSDPYEFFRNIKQLKKRKDKDEMLKSVDFELDFAEDSDRSNYLDISPDIFGPGNSADEYLQDKGVTSPVRGGTHEDYTNMFEVLRDFCINPDKTHNNDLLLGIYDGSYIPEKDPKFSVEIKLSCMAQYPRAIVIMINDTTQRDLVVSLQSNNKYKDSLIASISHELRTPLNGNLALIEAAIDHENTSRYLKENLLVPALRSGRLLVYKINEILDYSLMGSNSLKLNIVDGSITQTLKECYDFMELQAKRKGLNFTSLMRSDIPATFSTDHTRVKQVMLNLISNAIKFTFEGEVRIEAKMIDIVTIEITVQDTGIGMTADEIDRILGKSSIIYTGERVNKNSTGAGLGLTVSRKLARLLGPSDGQGITIQSNYGKGSTFSFILQKKLTKNRRSSNTSVTDGKDASKELFRDEHLPSSLDEFTAEINSPAVFLNGMKYTFSPKSKRHIVPRRHTVALFRMQRDLSLTEAAQILIVDDDPFNILALEALLKSLNLSSDKAYNGKEALEKVMQRNKRGNLNSMGYKLIIMDFNMPVMNGYEATKAIKELMDNGTLTKMKIVGCTAYNTKNDLDTGIKSGMSEVITKPVAKDILLPVLKRHLGFFY